MYTKTVSSPLGDIILTSDEKYLTGLFIKGQKYFLDGIKEKLHENNDLEILKQTEDWLTSYFAGKNPDVTKFICASGHFSEEDIQERLAVEIGNEDKYQVQYWPIFELNSNEFIGCCGLRPYKKNQYEMGFHLLPEYWGGKVCNRSCKRSH